MRQGETVKRPKEETPQKSPTQAPLPYPSPDFGTEGTNNPPVMGPMTTCPSSPPSEPGPHPSAFSRLLWKNHKGKKKLRNRGSSPPPEKFDYLLVYDLEATCNEARSLAPVEIIELSCVAVDVAQLAVVGEYQAYVKPTEHPTLDPFCVQLTGIQQQWVDDGRHLQEVLRDHHQWLEDQGVLKEGINAVPVTWTEWDLKVALETECGWRRLPKPDYLDRWIDLKKAYGKKYKKFGNLRNSVEGAGLEWEGRAHSGLDDARNTAALAMKLLREGMVLQITNAFVRVESTNQTAGSTNKKGEEGARQDPYNAQGQWTGKCHCGVAAHHRVTKKPGANLGREFFACGRWSILKKDDCGFFLWKEDAVLRGRAPG